METIPKTEFIAFKNKVAKARTLKGLPDLHWHDLAQYCQVLINCASMSQLVASMECSDRFDLIEDTDIKEDKGTDLLDQDIKSFCARYLGLELITQGDPRGAVFKLVVDATLGDSFGDRAHLCVPCVDAYQNFV